MLTFQEVFAKFDSSNSGLVSTKALGDLLRHMGINPTKEELQVARVAISNFFVNSENLEIRVWRKNCVNHKQIETAAILRKSHI